MSKLKLLVVAVALASSAAGAALAQESWPESTPAEVHQAAVASFDSAAVAAAVHEAVLGAVHRQLPGINDKAADQVATGASSMVIVALIWILEMILGVGKARSSAVGALWEKGKGILNPILALILGQTAFGDANAGALAAGWRSMLVPLLKLGAPLLLGMVKGAASSVSEAAAAKGKIGAGVLLLASGILLAQPSSAGPAKLLDRLAFSVGTGVVLPNEPQPWQKQRQFVGAQVGIQVFEHLAGRVRGTIVRAPESKPFFGSGSWEQPQAEVGLWITF